MKHLWQRLSRLAQKLRNKRPPHVEVPQVEHPHIVQRVDPEGKFIKIIITGGPYEGESVTVANFPSRLAGYEALKDCDPGDIASRINRP